MVLDDEEDVESCSFAAGRRRSLDATTNFDAGHKDVRAKSKDALADTDGYGTKDVPETQDLGPAE